MSAIIGGYTIDCNTTSLGGLKLVRLASLSDVDYIEEIGDVVNLGLKPNTSFYTFNLVKNVSSFSTTPNKDRSTGLIYFSESLNFVFNKMNYDTSVLVSKLFKASLVAIVEDRNGQYVLLGRTTGLKADSGTAGSGTSTGDRNGYDVQLTSVEKKITHVSPDYIRDTFYPDQYTRIFENVFASQFE